MIPFARSRLLDPWFDRLFRGDPIAIAILVLLVVVAVALGLYNRWRKGPDKDDDDSPQPPFWHGLLRILAYLAGAGLIFGAFKFQIASLFASGIILLSGSDLVAGDGGMWWSRWQTWDETTARIISGVIVAIAGLVLVVAIVS
jgi:hypothetical protein